jgi:ATP/maltotriose-dependent transcriptional regulator MalT
VALTLRPLAALRAMLGEFEQARSLIREGNEILDDLGGLSSAACHHEAFVEMLAGRPEAAERRLRLGYERLEEMGERALLATTAAMLAQALQAQGRDDEAEALAELGERTAAPEDLATQVVVRGVRARILARRGDAGRAEAQARAAVELAGPTDLLPIRADALLDLGEVLALAGRAEEADAVTSQARELLELKGSLVAAERARSLRPAATHPRANGGR